MMARSKEEIKEWLKGLMGDRDPLHKVSEQVRTIGTELLIQIETLYTILIAKGICSLEEIEQTRTIVCQSIDQKMAAARERIRESEADDE